MTAREEMSGKIVTASFEDGIDHGPLCGMDDCECPDHDGRIIPAGTYITIRLDADVPIGLWRVTVAREVSS